MRFGCKLAIENMPEPMEDIILPTGVTTLVLDNASEAAEYRDTPDTDDSFMEATESALPGNGGMIYGIGLPV